jgi:hypothetical protein
MTIKRARKKMAQALKDNPQFKWHYGEVIARYIIENQRKADKCDLKSFPSVFTLAEEIIDLIFKG